MPHGVHATTTPTHRELRDFGRTVGLAFVLLGTALAWRGRTMPATGAAVLGVALLVCALAAPDRLATVHRAWMALALAISRVTTPIFMGALYFLVLAPAGLLMRALGRRPLVRPRGAASYWVDRPADARRSDLHRQF